MKENIRKDFLNVTAGLTTLLAVEGNAQDNQQIEESAPVKIEQIVEQRVDYMNPNYSRQEVNDKLNKLYKNIKGTDEQIEGVKSLLQRMAQYGIGQRTIMQMPENIAFTIDETRELERKNAAAYYSSGNKLIRLKDDFEGDYRLTTLAHEMRHAIQDADGRFKKSSPFPSDKFVQDKICEMETRLQDVVFESQINQSKSDKDKSPRCLFYEAELNRYKKAGLSQKDAERSARTSVVQAYWTGLNELPKGCSEITQGFCDEINSWNNHYDLQTVNVFPKDPQKQPAGNKLDIEGAEKREQEQAEAEKNNWAGIKRNNTLLPKYASEMDVNVSADWFTASQRERSTVGDYFVVNYYPSGALKTECFATNNGYTLRELSEPTAGNQRGIILHEVSCNSKRYKTGYEIYRHPNGQLKSMAHFNDGLEDGTRQNYDANGNLESEIVRTNGIKTDKIYYYKDGKTRESEYIYGKDSENEGNYTVKWYREDGTLSQECEYKNKKKDGEYKWYHPDGKTVKTKTQFKNGVEQSPRYRYRNDSTLESIAETVNGEECGLKKIFREDGKTLKSKFYVENGKKNGLAEYYREDGTLDWTVTFKDDQKIGAETHYASDGKTKESEYIYGEDSENEGNYTVKWYREDGTLSQECEYKNKKKDGEYKWYHPDGKTVKTKTQFKNGVEQGSRYRYRNDSTLESVVETVNGEECGLKQTFREDGKTPKSKFHVKNGKKNGLAEYYREDGTLDWTVTFKDDQKDGVETHYASDGKTVEAKIFFENGKRVQQYSNKNNEETTSASNTANGVNIAVAAAHTKKINA